ncbi:MAG: molybdopterin-synthase adenylyltransferase MoeB [Bacteroidetes bacterium]|nr:molybdopterin-synthase adenylyltransferase MoeB [Bacteroidota bacterium]
MLTQDENLRYSRQMCLPEIGTSGQKKLKSSSVAIVGLGGLGSPLALYLAAAGIGHLGLIDFDIVGISNLHRQILYKDVSIGESKLKSASKTLKSRNPNIKISIHEVRLNQENALDILKDYQIVADCSDNFSTRYLVNDSSVLLGIPNVSGSVYQFEGQISIFGAQDGPCYRCIHPTPPHSDLIPNCAESGVLGVLPGLIGTLQANEVIKLLLGIGNPLIGRMAMINLIESDWDTIAFQKNPDCQRSGQCQQITELVEYVNLCESDEIMTVHEFGKLIRNQTPFYLLDVRQSHEADSLEMGADQRLSVDELSDRISEINADVNDQIIVHCQTGVRSLKATHILRHKGFHHAKSLDGGIIAWKQFEEHKK